MGSPNVYAPPAAGVRAGGSRGFAPLETAAWLSGLLFLVLLFSALAMRLGASTLALRLGASTPVGLLPLWLLSAIHWMHASLAFAFVSAMELVLLAAVVPFGAGDSARRKLYLATAGLIGLLAATQVFRVFLPVSEWFEAPLRWVPPSALAVSLIWAAWRSRQVLGPVATVLLAPALAVAVAPPARPESSFLLSVLALLLTRPRQPESEPQRGAGLPRFAGVALVLNAVLAFRCLVEGAHGFPSFLWYLVSLHLVGIAWRHGTSARDRSSVRWAARSGLMILAIALLLGLFLQGLNVDVHLYDTLMVTAANHATTLGLAVLLLAIVLRQVEGASLPAHVGRFRLGIVAYSIGTVGFVTLFAYLGIQGMPEGYAAYLPEFARLHQAASVAVMILAAGVLILAMGAIRQRLRPSPTVSAVEKPSR